MDIFLCLCWLFVYTKPMTYGHRKVEYSFVFFGVVYMCKTMHQNKDSIAFMKTPPMFLPLNKVIAKLRIRRIHPLLLHTFHLYHPHPLPHQIRTHQSPIHQILPKHILNVVFGIGHRYKMLR